MNSKNNIKRYNYTAPVDYYLEEDKDGTYIEAAVYDRLKLASDEAVEHLGNMIEQAEQLELELTISVEEIKKLREQRNDLLEAIDWPDDYYMHKRRQLLDAEIMLAIEAKVLEIKNDAE